jgi:predicted kinase
LHELEKVAGLLDQRARQGKVRHGHGDLHLANICLWQGRPVAFDCLEFSAELATTDLLYDLAFLLMDLWQKGHVGAANLIANRYADRVGEEDGWPALPLFMSVRAAIRAHVGGATAARMTGRRARKRPGGAGLSRCGAAIPGARRTGLDCGGGIVGDGEIDSGGRPCAENGRGAGRALAAFGCHAQGFCRGRARNAPSPQSYTREASAQVYAAMTDRAHAMLERGWPVVVDAVFAAPDERAAIEDMARKANVPFLGLWLEADGAVMQQRVDARRGDASDADAGVVARQMTYDCGDLSAWRRIAANGSRDAVVAQALAATQHLFILQKS